MPYLIVTFLKSVLRYAITNYEIMKMNCKDNIGTWGGGWTLTPTPRIFKFIKLS